ncbi:hypothetical protein PAXRUDRAFT_145043, partial [Paxillus rubicundulus Ve08.2h10]
DMRSERPFGRHICEMKVTDSDPEPCPIPATHSKAIVSSPPLNNRILGDEERADFLVHRLVHYDQALLEPIKGDCNTQTLARSRNRMDDILCVVSFVAFELVESKVSLKVRCVFICQMWRRLTHPNSL